MNAVTETLRIDDMECKHCVAAVQATLSELEAVEVRGVKRGSARIRYDPERTPRPRIIGDIEKAGYRVRPSAWR